MKFMSKISAALVTLGLLTAASAQEPVKFTIPGASAPAAQPAAPSGPPATATTAQPPGPSAPARQRVVPVKERTDHAAEDLDPDLVSSAKFKLGQPVQLLASGFAGTVRGYRSTNGKQLRYDIAFDGYDARPHDPIGYAEEAIRAYDPSEGRRARTRAPVRYEA